MINLRSRRLVTSEGGEGCDEHGEGFCDLLSWEKSEQPQDQREGVSDPRSVNV